jgi:LysM repeat protein
LIPCSTGSSFFHRIASSGLSLPVAKAQGIEPGLERAVKWKWNVAPPVSAAWGLPVREVPVIAQAQPSAAGAASTALPPAQNTCIVQKGDVLVRIAKKLHLSVAQLKEFNSLENDFLKIGQELRIPTPEEKHLLKSTPKPAANSPQAQSAPALTEIANSEVLLLRVFLDNQNFGTGPISDAPDPLFGRVLNLYQTARGETLDYPAMVDRARQYTRDTLGTYTLRAEDFRFIAPPKAARAISTPPATKPGAKPKPAPTPPPTYQEMIAADFLAYRSPWEFVAERFHCDEAFLRKLNPSLPDQPMAGSIFRVPNVLPFEIEKVPAFGIQPAPDPAQPLSAKISDVTTLEIFRSGRLVAVMPIGRARPGLRGRGEWKIRCHRPPAARHSSRGARRSGRKNQPVLHQSKSHAGHRATRPFAGAISASGT